MGTNSTPAAFDTAAMTSGEVQAAKLETRVQLRSRPFAEATEELTVHKRSAILRKLPSLERA